MKPDTRLLMAWTALLPVSLWLASGPHPRIAFVLALALGFLPSLWCMWAATGTRLSPWRWPLALSAWTLLWIVVLMAKQPWLAGPYDGGPTFNWLSDVAPGLVPLFLTPPLVVALAMRFRRWEQPAAD